MNLVVESLTFSRLCEGLLVVVSVKLQHRGSDGGEGLGEIPLAEVVWVK